MKYFIYLIVIFFLLIVETGILGQFQFLPVVPYLLVIFSAILVPLEEKRLAIFTIAASGVILDFISGLPDGIMLLSLGFACLTSFVLVYWWLAKEYNIGILFVSVGATTLVFIISVLIFSKLFSLMGLGSGIDYAYLIIHRFVWYLVLNLILTYPMYLFYLFLSHTVSKRWPTKAKI